MENGKHLVRYRKSETGWVDVYEGGDPERAERIYRNQTEMRTEVELITNGNRRLHFVEP